MAAVVIPCARQRRISFSRAVRSMDSPCLVSIGQRLPRARFGGQAAFERGDSLLSVPQDVHDRRESRMEGRDGEERHLDRLALARSHLHRKLKPMNGILRQITRLVRHRTVSIAVDVSALVAAPDDVVTALAQNRPAGRPSISSHFWFQRMIRSEESIAKTAFPLRAILSRASVDVATGLAGISLHGPPRPAASVPITLR